MNTTNLEKEIVEGLDPQIITALYKNFSNPYIALEELIDNAIDDLIVGRKLVINIQISNKKIKISNINGKGMSFEDLVQFFQWGKSGKKEKIGRFGQGGKAALGYLCKSWNLRTKSVGSDYEYFIEIDDWEDRTKGLKKIQPNVMRSLREGFSSIVVFELWNLKHEIDLRRLIREIKEIYRPFILNNEVEFIVNGETLHTSPVNYDEGYPKKFSIALRLEEKDYNISGEYGIVSDTKSLRAGIRCYQFKRLVAQKEYFGHVTPHSKWSLERLSGDLFIDFPVDLLMNKTNINRDSKEWRLITNAIHNELTEIVRILQGYRSPSVHETRTIKKVGKVLKEQDDRKDLAFEFTNYGKTVLFKTRKEPDNKVKLLINREFPAYKMWGKTTHGEKLYIIFIYSLFEASESLGKKEANIFINKFTEVLMQNCPEQII